MNRVPWYDRLYGVDTQPCSPTSISWFTSKKKTFFYIFFVKSAFREFAPICFIVVRTLLKRNKMVVHLTPLNHSTPPPLDIVQTNILVRRRTKCSSVWFVDVRRRQSKSVTFYKGPRGSSVEASPKHDGERQHFSIPLLLLPPSSPPFITYSTVALILVFFLCVLRVPQALLGRGCVY